MSNPSDKVSFVSEEAEAGSSRVRHLFSKRMLALVLAAILLGCVGIVALVEIWPSAGAFMANRTRVVFGPRFVAQMEEIVFQIQDQSKQWGYAFTNNQVDAPWDDSGAGKKSTPYSQGNQQGPAFTQTVRPEKPAPPFLTKTPTDLTDSQPGPPPTFTATPVATATPTPWTLPALSPFGNLEGEGTWLPYLYGPDGQVLARRTFLQPDPVRPYTIVAVVAFDLTRSRLHFVLGFNEPSLPEGPRGDGLIPAEDRQAGHLLAAFNGGFRAANGNFGAMADGIEALPPKLGFATVGIYRDGQVRIGNWGEDITPTPDLVAWRQNCRLILQDGEISPRVHSNSITDWGASISNQIVTRRSSLGVDRDAGTLYYFAGPSLSMPVLADVMLAVGVHDGMLLDINHFWVHFTAIQAGEDGELVAKPLLPEDMHDHVDRYLGPSPADFFYITAVTGLDP